MSAAIKLKDLLLNTTNTRSSKAKSYNEYDLKLNNLFKMNPTAALRRLRRKNEETVVLTSYAIRTNGDDDAESDENDEELYESYYYNHNLYRFKFRLSGIQIEIN